MIADIALAKRAEQGIGQGMHAHIGIGMTLQFRRMRNGMAADDHRRTGLESVHVKAMACAALADALSGRCVHVISFAAEEGERHAEILRLRYFHIVGRTGDERNAHAGRFGDGGIIGQLPAGGGLMRGKDRRETKALRGLRPPQPVTRHGLFNRRVGAIRSFDGVKDRQGGDRAVMALKGRADPADGRRIDKRARGVMNENGLGARAGKALQAEPNGILPLSAARDRRHEFGMVRMPRNRLRIEISIIAMNDDAHSINLRMAEKGTDRARQHSVPGKITILLRPAGPGARAPSGGDNDGNSFHANTAFRVTKGSVALQSMVPSINGRSCEGPACIAPCVDGR